jgi:hypothetical protein
MKEKSFLEKFVGEYVLGQMTATVTLRGENKLILTVPGQPKYELVPYKGTEFNLKDLSGYSVEFMVNKAGKVIEVKFNQPNGIFTAKKIRRSDYKRSRTAFEYNKIITV